jgi:hypothetical protein
MMRERSGAQVLAKNRGTAGTPAWWRSSATSCEILRKDISRPPEGSRGVRRGFAESPRKSLEETGAVTLGPSVPARPRDTGTIR